MVGPTTVSYVRDVADRIVAMSTTTGGSTKTVRFGFTDGSDSPDWTIDPSLSAAAQVLKHTIPPPGGVTVSVQSGGGHTFRRCRDNCDSKLDPAGSWFSSPRLRKTVSHQNSLRGDKFGSNRYQNPPSDLAGYAHVAFVAAAAFPHILPTCS